MTIAGPDGIRGARYDPSPLSPRAPVSPGPPPLPSRPSFPLVATQAVAASARHTIPTRKLIRAGIHFGFPVTETSSLAMKLPARGTVEGTFQRRPWRRVAQLACV